MTRLLRLPKAALPAKSARERRPADFLVDQSEAVFQASVVRGFRQAGWLVYHTHRSDHSEPGFPDLVCVRADGYTIFAELKSTRPDAAATAEQREWLDRLSRGGHAAYLWYPWHADEADTIAGYATGKRIADIPRWPYEGAAA